MARPVILAGLLGAAVGVPYVVSQGPEGFPDFAQRANDPRSGQPVQSSAFSSASLPDIDNLGPQSDIYGHPAPIGGVRTHTLAEVLRFDITKDWVYHRWTRKSTGLSDPKYFGVRVPLVTGTGMADLAGSLTYFFDQAGAVQRIEFRGTTADTSQLLAILSNQYGLRPSHISPPGEQRLELSNDRGLESYVQTTPAGVLWGNQPHESFRVNMVLNRPGMGHIAAPPTARLQAVLPALGDAAGEAGSSVSPLFPSEGTIPTAAGNQAQSDTPATDQSLVDEHGFRGRRPGWRWPN